MDLRNPKPDKTTVAALAWMIIAGAVVLLAVLALLLRSGLDALGRKPVFVLALSGLLALVIVVRLWMRGNT